MSSWPEQPPSPIPIESIVQTEESADAVPPSTEHQATFVDYVALPEVRVRPPAKYKLWAIVWILVFFGSWFASEANLVQALRLRGWLSPNASLFFMLAMIVFVMVYGALDLVVELGTFTYKDETFGLGPWLKAGRAKWMYKFSEHNLLIQILAMIVWKLEDGFGMFDTSAPSPPPKSTHIRGKRRSRHPGSDVRVESNGTSSSSSESSDQHQRQAWDSESTRIEFEYDFDEEEAEEDVFHCDSDDCRVLLRIEHRIDPVRLNEYEKWKGKIRLAIQQQRGFLKIECGDSKVDDERDTTSGSGKDLEAAAVSALTPHRHVVYCTFINIGYLNEWLLSPRRKVLMKELSPLLAKPDIVQIQKDRILPDAFTDLVIAQGQCVPSMAPKKWKVWWLTSLALFVTIRWTRSFMPYYYEFWGLSDPHLQSLVGTAVSTLLNSYVMVPLVLFVFNPWMQRHKFDKDEREPWRTLDDGLRSIWSKALLAFVFYGGCVIAWIVRVQARND